MSKFIGMNQEREWLESKGFKIFKNSIAREENNCNWGAQRLDPNGTPCECNEKNGISVNVMPFHYFIGDVDYHSFKVEITGQADGIWHSFKSYGINFETLKDDIDSIQAALVTAWNAIPREQT